MQSEVIHLSPYFTKLDVPHKAKRIKTDLKRLIATIGPEDRRNTSDVLSTELDALCRYGVVMGFSVHDDTCRWVLSLNALHNTVEDEYVQALDQLALVLTATQESLGYHRTEVQTDTESDDAVFFVVLLLAHSAQFARRYGVPADLLDSVSAATATAWLRSLQLTSSHQLRVGEAIELIERHGVRLVVELPRTAEVNSSILVDESTTITEKNTEVEMLIEDTKLDIWHHVYTHDESTWRWYVEQDQNGRPLYVSFAIEGASGNQRIALDSYVVLCNDLLRAGEVSVLPRVGASLDERYFTEKLANGVGPVGDFALAFASKFAPDVAVAIARDVPKDQVLLDIADETTRYCEICASDRVEAFGSYGICLNCGGAQSIA